jgi:hypothetical protein
VLQAAIAVCHAQAPSAKDTDWAQIASLYDALAQILPTPIVHLNRAVAVGRARGPQAGLDLVDGLLDDPALRDYHLLPGVRGDLLLQLERFGEARLEFERAASLAHNTAQRDFLVRRAAELPSADANVVTLGAAGRGFLARADFNAQTVRSYGQTIRRLCLTLGEQLPLTSLTADAVARVFDTAWAGAAAATWNRHRAAVRSFGAWALLGDLASGLDRRPETRPRTATIATAQLDELCTRTDLRLRERTLWRLLNESAASVHAILSLDIDQLDLADQRARATTTGERVSWRAGTALLLPELIADRTRGPLFLADRRPAPARPVAQADLCPETGRRRLSYERAEYLFKQATKTFDPAGDGYTLRQLKPRN